MSLPGRVFDEALRFGSTGGALLGGVQGFLLDETMAPDVLGTVVGLATGGFLGGAISYGALMLGSIAEDKFRRPWGALVTGLVALLLLLALTWGWDVTSPWLYIPGSGIAAYAAVVAWFRIPRILAA